MSKLECIDMTSHTSDHDNYDDVDYDDYDYDDDIIDNVDYDYMDDGDGDGDGEENADLDYDYDDNGNDDDDGIGLVEDHTLLFNNASTSGLSNEYCQIDTTSWIIQSDDVSFPSWISREEEQAKHVADLFEISLDTSLILLRAYNWNEERLHDQYLDNPTEAEHDIGLSPNDFETFQKVEEDCICEICCSDLKGGIDYTYGLACGHRACLGCTQHMVYTQIHDRSGEATCFGYKCHYKLRDSDVLKLVNNNESLYHRYRETLLRKLVIGRPDLAFCPSASCSNIIVAPPVTKRLFNDTEISPSTGCSCGSIFCLRCSSLPPHIPCPCFIAKAWDKKCKEDSETAHWMHVYTKDCPKCVTAIEKNGGCNHMVCKNCSYEFCWICMGDWQDHGRNYYSCSQYDSTRLKNAADEQSRHRELLKRYLHFYERFQTHETSIKLQDNLYNATEAKMASIQKTQKMTWIETQFLKRAVQTLARCRRTLQWTYVMSYFLDESNAVTVFVNNQDDLSLAVENLSALVEQPINPDNLDSIRQSITNQTAYVEKRCSVVLRDAFEGYLEGRWKWKDFNDL